MFDMKNGMKLRGCRQDKVNMTVDGKWMGYPSAPAVKLFETILCDERMTLDSLYTQDQRSGVQTSSR